MNLDQYPTPRSNKAWQSFIVEGSAISTLRPEMERLERENAVLREALGKIADRVEWDLKNGADMWWLRNSKDARTALAETKGGA